MSRLRRVLVGLVTVAVFVVVLAGMPYGLILLGRRVAGAGVDWRAAVAEPQWVPLLLLAVMLVGWLLWGWLLYATVADLVDGVRHTTRTARLPISLYTAVTSIAGAAVLLTSTAAEAAPPPSPSGPDTSAAVSTAMSAAMSAARHAGPARGHPTDRTVAATPAATVWPAALDEPYLAVRGVTLHGGWLPLPAAAAMGAAAALLWTHVRRRYQPRPPRATPRDDAGLRPLPREVTVLRHRLAALGDDAIPADTGPTDAGPADTIAGDPNPPNMGPAPRSTAFWAATDTADACGGHLADLPAGGLGLVGPGGGDAMRGILVAALIAAADPARPGPIVLTTANTLRTLLGQDHHVLGAAATVRIVPTLDLAIDQLDSLARVDGLDWSDWPPKADEETGPTAQAQQGAVIVLHVGPITAGTSARLHAVSARPARRTVRPVLLGAWPHGTTWSVEADGTIRHPAIDTAAAPPRVPRVAVLNTATAVALCTTLARLWRATISPDESPAPPYRPPPPPAEQHINGRTEGAVHLGPTSATSLRSAPFGQAPPQRPALPELSAPSGQAPLQEPSGWPDPPPLMGAPRRLVLRLLGGSTLHLPHPDGSYSEVPLRRSAGWQILTYLAVHRGGASTSELKEALWPEVTSNAARTRFNSTISILRTDLHTAAGAVVLHSSIDRVEPARSRHWLDPHHLQVDLWQWQDLLGAADLATDPVSRRRLLHTAAALCDGELAHSASYPWLEPDREHLTRQIIDVLADLAATEPDHSTALRLLRQATRHAPHNETLYQQVMRRHAAAGNPEGITRTLATLAEHLADLHATPSAATQHLASDLHTQAIHQSPNQSPNQPPAGLPARPRTPANPAPAATDMPVPGGVTRSQERPIR